VEQLEPEPVVDDEAAAISCGAGMRKLAGGPFAEIAHDPTLTDGEDPFLLRQRRAPGRGT
jgi:hypothetical protein